MKCPNCPSSNLEASTYQKRAQVDVCPQCLGIWLDKGEIFMITNNPSLLESELKTNAPQRKPGKKMSPISGNPMQEIALFNRGLLIDFCEDSHGFWLDEGECKYIWNLNGTPPTKANLAKNPTATPSKQAVREKKSANYRKPSICHEVDFQIYGNDLQIVEIELDKNETVVAEAGAMTYMDFGISFQSMMGDGSKPDEGMMGKLLSVGKRVLTGESIFMTHFTNISGGKKHVAFGAPYPGKIIPLNLQGYQGRLLCQKDAFLAAAKGTSISIAFTKKLGAGFFGGEGFILQKLEGDGMVFIHVGGTVVEKKLQGEKILIDTGCLAAFTSGLTYSIERAGSLKSMFFGGEGLFLATLKGTGTVWIQSLPISRLADRIVSSSSVASSSNGGTSVIGALGSFLNND